MSLENSPSFLLNFSGCEMSGEAKQFYRFKSFRLSILERQLLHESTPVPLTPKAFDVLAALVERNGHLVEKEELLKLVWGDSFVEEANVARIVHTLRKVLGEDDNGNKFIETVAKKGYRFVAEVTEVREGGASESADEKPDAVKVVEPLSADESQPLPGKADNTVTLLGEVKRRKLWVAIAAATLIAVVASVYYLYAKRGGEPIESVAVLPFVNATGDPNTEYLPDVISDSIINSLYRLPNLRVISFYSVLPYKGKQVHPQAVGRELNVQAVLMGTMTKRGDGLTISAELVDVRDGRLLWGEQYNRKLADVIDVTQEVARGITEKLRLRLGSTDEPQLTKRYTESIEAHQAYLKGRSIYIKALEVVPFLTPEAKNNSIKYFEEAIRLDPNYALAYATLANLHIATSGGIPPAKAAVAKALEIDGTLAEAHAVEGYIRMEEGDWSGAEDEFKLARTLNPNYERYPYDYALYLLFAKRLDEAIAESKRAVELNPLSVLHNRSLAHILYYARRYDEAIKQCRRTLELAPDVPAGSPESNRTRATSPRAYAFLASAYEQKKLYDQAVDAWLKTNQFTIHGSEAEKAFREAYAASGIKGFWRKLLDLKKERAKHTNVQLSSFAEAYAHLGEKEQTFAWLQRDIPVTFPMDPLWDFLRSDPRYRDLVRRRRLEQWLE